MMRHVLASGALAVIAGSLMGCGGGGGGPSPTPAPPATPAPPPPGPTTTVTTTVNPDDVPNPFCGHSDNLEKALGPSPPPGATIGWNPTSAKVGTGWCTAEVPESAWNLKDYCGSGTLKANSTLKAKAAPEVKVLTYNLYWWNLYGQRGGNNNEAGKNMVKYGPYDLMGFQECEDMPRVLTDLKSAGDDSTYTEKHIYNSYVNVCMAYATNVFDELGYGVAEVAEDRSDMHYGKRVAHWVRLNHKASGKKVFFINHHGPTPPGTGGLCGNKATAYNLLKAIAENAKVGDSVIFVGDFNAPWLLHTGTGELVWAEEAGVISCHIPHVFANPTLEDINGVDNFFATCSTLKEKTVMPKGGSDHNALNAVFELTGPSAFDLDEASATEVVV